MKHALIAVLSLLLLAACAGDDGAAGPPGPTGPQGPAGAPGAPGSAIDLVALCSHIEAGLLFGYEVITYTTGETMAICSISDAATTTGTSFLWPAGTLGAAQAQCLLTFDVDVFSAGFWEFRADGGARATYNDATSVDNGAVVTFAAGECVTG